MKQAILFITPYVPFPLNSGGNQGQFHMIDEIRKHYDASMIFEVPETEKQHFEQLKALWPDVHFMPYFEQAAVRPKPKKKLFKKFRRHIKSLFKKRQVADNLPQEDFVRKNSTLFHSCLQSVKEDFVRHLNHCLEQNFDIIQVEFYEFLSLIHCQGMKKSRAKKIFVHHELRYVRNEREMALYKEISPFDQYLFNASKEYETTTLDLYDHVITVSDTDKELLKKQLSKPVYASPSVIQQNSPGAGAPLQNKIVFIGGFYHFPNRDGIMWFLENCWPAIAVAIPDIQLDIIGPNWEYGTLGVSKDSVSRIHCKGYVEDLSDAIAGCIMIVPLRIGSGMRMKIIDGVNNQCSIVTTTIGVEGIDLVSGENCLIADKAKDFAHAVIHLANNPDVRIKMLENMQKTALLQHPEKQLEKRLHVYSDILK